MKDEVIFRGYLLLFASFLISTMAVAVEGEIKADDLDRCANAVVDNSGKTLFTTSKPEQWLLDNMSMIDDPQSDKFVQMLTGFKNLMDMLAERVEEEGEIPYTEYRTYHPNYKGNLATLLFHGLLDLYQSVLSYHEEMDNDMTRNIVNIYQQRMKILLSDKDKEVDVNYQVGGANFLMIAASNGHDDIVELLLEREVNLSYRPVNGRFQGQTVLAITREALSQYENQAVDATITSSSLSLNLNRYEDQTVDATDRDPEHVRIKKIERYNRTIALLEEANTRTWSGSFRRWFRR